MARLLTTGFEFQDLIADGFAAAGATPTIDTGTKRTGAASLKCTGNVYWRFDSGLSGVQTLYARAYCYFTAFTTAASTANYCTVLTNGGSLGGGACVNKNGVLAAAAADGVSPGTRLGTGTNPTLSLSTWYCIETKIVFDGTAHATSIEVRLDGTVVSTWTGTSTSTDGPNQWYFGDQWASLGQTVFFDDVGINSASGSDQNGYPGAASVVLLRPTSDSAVGTGWQKPSQTAPGTNIFSALDNVAAANMGVADSNVVGNIEKYVRNAASTTTGDLDENVTTYTAAGVGSTDIISLVQLVMTTAQPVNGTARAGAYRVVSNPAQGAEEALTTFAGSAAQATHPTGWKRVSGTVLYLPTVTKGTAPVLRVGKRVANVAVVSVDNLGLYVEFTPAAGQALEGTDAGTSTDAGDLTVAHTLAATDAGTSTSTGNVTVAHPLAGTEAGTSTSTGNVTVAHPLAGTDAGTSASTGDLTVTRGLAATDAGTSASTGDVTVAHPLAATDAGTSTSTGDLTVTGPAGSPQALAATDAGTSTSTGNLTVAHPLAGTDAGTSTSTGDLTVPRALVATDSGTSTSTGNLTVAHPLAATDTGTSTSTGDLIVTHPLAATDAGTSTSTGNLTVAHPLAGTEGGTSVSTGNLTVAHPLAGTDAGTSVSSGSLSSTGDVPTGAGPRRLLLGVG